MVIWVLEKRMAEEEIRKDDSVIWEAACIGLVAKTPYLIFFSVLCSCP